MEEPLHLPGRPSFSSLKRESSRRGGRWFGGLDPSPYLEVVREGGIPPETTSVR